MSLSKDEIVFWEAYQKIMGECVNNQAPDVEVTSSPTKFIRCNPYIKLTQTITSYSEVA